MPRSLFGTTSPPHALSLHSRSLFCACSESLLVARFALFFSAAIAPLHFQPPSQTNIAVVATQVPRSIFGTTSPPHALSLHSRLLFGARSESLLVARFAHFFSAASAPLHSQPPSQKSVAVVAAQVPRSIFGTTSPPHALLRHSRSLFGARSESLLVARFAHFFSAASAPLHSQPPSQQHVAVVAAQVPRSIFGTTSPPHTLSLHSRSLFGARSESLLVVRFAHFFSAASAPLHSQPPS